MKKIILLILFIITTTGCTVEYDLVIDTNELSENLNLKTEEFDTKTKDELYSKYLDEYPIYIDDEFLYYSPTEKEDGVIYYEKNINETLYGYDATYKGKYNFEDFNKSRILNTAFNNQSIGYDRQNNLYYIIVQNLKIFNYNQTISSIKVNIKIDGYKIVETNAHSQNGNYLTWTFYKSNNNKLC